MSQLPAAIAIRLEGKTSFTVAMTVIEELCAENAALRAEKEKLAAENKRLQDQLAQLQAKLGVIAHPQRGTVNLLKNVRNVQTPSRHTSYSRLFSIVDYFSTW